MRLNVHFHALVLDGVYVHAEPRAADARRDVKLERLGYRVLRLDAEFVLREVARAVALLRDALANFLIARSHAAIVGNVLWLLNRFIYDYCAVMTQIKTLNQLLLAIRETSLAAVSAEPFATITHGGIIGDMYEGITTALLNGALFSRFDLQIAKGLIRLPDETQSRQVDCMLAVGPGSVIPGTEHRIYDLHNVVAVIETTKRLRKEKLHEDLGKLSILSKTALSARMRTTNPVHGRMHHEAYRAVVGEPLPSPNVLERDLPFKTAVALALLDDVTLPLRIVWAYEGYETEHGLRSAFADWAEQLGPPELVRMPNMIICGDFCIVKSNGMPFSSFVRTDADWDLCYSQARHAVRNFLNILWYRLSRFYNLQFAYLADGKVYRENPLLSVCYSDELELGVTRWDADRDAISAPEEIAIPPTELAVEEYVAISILCEQPDHPSLDLNNEEVQQQFRAKCDAAAEFAQSTGLRMGGRLEWGNGTELAHELTRSSLLTRTGAVVRLNTVRCFAWWNESGMFAGENRDGRYWGAPAREPGTRDSDDLAPNAEWMTENTHDQLLQFVNWQTQRVQSAPAFRVRGVHRGDFGVRPVTLKHGEWQLEVTSGTFGLIWDLFNRVFSHRDAFPAVGDPAKEVIATPTLPQLFSSAGALSQAATKPGEAFSSPTPRCAVRRAYAIHLVDLSLRFIVGAEVARILRGHVGYADAVLQGTARAPTPDERKALRFDKDGYACWDLLRYGLGILKHEAIEAADSNHHYRSREQIAVDVALAMHGALLLDRDLNRLARVPGAERFHRVHQGMLLGFVMRKCCYGSDPGEEERIRKAVASAIKAFERAVGAVTGRSSRDDSLVAGFRDGLRGDVAEAWFTVCPVLRSYSCDPLADCERPDR